MDPVDEADALLAAAARGDADAFGAFFTHTVDPVLRYFATRVRDPEAAARSKLVDSARRGAVQRRARERLALEPVVLDDPDIERVCELADRMGSSEIVARKRVSRAITQLRRAMGSAP